MESINAANEVKRRGREWGKNTSNRDKFGITNAITLATRVRIEVLKAITTKFSQGNERIYLTQHEVRPYIRAVNMSSKKEKVLIYPDAIEQYGLGLKKRDLQKAYEKAGTVFKGQLAHTFVMLFDEDDEQEEEEEIEEETMDVEDQIQRGKNTRKRRANTAEPNGTPVKKQNTSKNN